MTPALASLIAVAGPEVIALVIALIKDVQDKNPAAITSEQWSELQTMFAETYEQRKARIAAELKAAGQL